MWDRHEHHHERENATPLSMFWSVMSLIMLAASLGAVLYVICH